MQCVSLWSFFEEAHIFYVRVDSGHRFHHYAWFNSGYMHCVYGFFVFLRNAWFDSGYTCRARRRVGSGMVFAGLLVPMISRCVHFVVGRPVESSQVHSLRQFQLLALPAGMWGRLFGALWKGTGPGVVSTGTRPP